METKLLLDENVSNKIKDSLIKLGTYEIKHINDVGKGITDREVFELAQREKRILITGDDDFKDNNFKYKIPIIWITPKARVNNYISIQIDWILENIKNYNIIIERAFITIKPNEYCIEYKNKTGVFGKIQTRKIGFEKVKLKMTSDKR